MARRDALLRLHKSLVKRRSELFRRLGTDFEDLGHSKHASTSGDSADAAFGSAGEEIASTLAEFEARELQQIDRALFRLKQGTYGLCEVCAAKIPVARLNALPYSTLCINCQREAENDSSWLEGRRLVDWEKVADADARSAEPRDIDLSDLEMDLSK